MPHETVQGVGALVVRQKWLEWSPRDACRTCCAREHRSPARSHALEPPAGRRSKGAIEACICHLHFRAPELKIARFLRSRDASGWTALFKFNKYIACAHTRLRWQHTAHVHMLSLHCREGNARVHTNTTSSSKHLSASSRHGAQRGHAARTCNSACSAQARARGMQCTAAAAAGSRLPTCESAAAASAAAAAKATAAAEECWVKAEASTAKATAAAAV